MTDAINSVIKAIADDVLILAQLIMEDDSVGMNTKVDWNTLRDSRLKNDVQTRIASLNEPVVIEALFNHYIEYLEWDRPKDYGKQPPIEALKDWASARGIPTDNSTLFAIAKAIKRDGHEGRPILAKLEQEVAEGFENEYFEKLFDAVIDELNKYFN